VVKESGLKGVVLFSGGIDSPVAAYLAAKQGVELSLLHMNICPWGTDGFPASAPSDTSPSSLDEVQKIQKTHKERLIALAKTLSGLTRMPIALYAVPYAHVQMLFREKCKENLTCVLCKRMMLRFASAFAKKHRIPYIITGESLGQVASQTLQNLRTETDASEGVVILRPNIGLDKQEIVDIAKRIKTFETSVMKDISCQALPPRPSTVSTPSLLRTEEEKIPLSSITEELLSKVERWL